jgi:hypothetical protein
MEALKKRVSDLRVALQGLIADSEEYEDFVSALRSADDNLEEAEAYEAEEE